jgi:SAM-dependent methyltransferase
MRDAMLSISGEGGSFIPPTSDSGRALRLYELRKGDHVQRYLFASSVIGSGSVLDLGCGHGLGAFYLLKEGRSYIGVDSDVAAVSWASENVPLKVPSAKFVHADAFNKGNHSGEFDAIVLLEVIEHVDQPRLLLDWCLAMLRVGGKLVLSTPNGYLSEGSARLHQSEYHVREFNAQEVARLLLESGFSADLYRQHRVDHLDSIPQLAKRAYLGVPHAPDRPTEGWPGRADRQDAGHARGRLTLPYRIFQLVPAWRTLWRTHLLESGRGSPWSYSHILAVARRQ